MSRPSADSLQVVSSAWSVALEIDEIDPQDSFFDLGGDSFAAVQIAVTLTEATHVEVAVVDLFLHHTAGDLAALIDSRRGTPDADRDHPGSS
jgi:acyl carrier protein